jgi:peptide/nickel transport system permease protein
MLSFITRRIVLMIPTILIISFLVFVIIELPPGDYLTSYVMNLQMRGETVDKALLEGLTIKYGLDKPFYHRYFKWVKGLLVGDLGFSFKWNMPVRDVIGERLAYTIAIAFLTLIFTWAIAFPIGVYSATHQYKAGDYIATFFGFIGLATPGFMLALILMFIGMKYFGVSVGGLFSPSLVDAQWSWRKFIDLLKHVWVPIVVIGLAETAGLIRILRANLLDELSKPYVVAARARGKSGLNLLLKYPVRVAINPLLSTIGYSLPALFSGSTIVAVVLSLPTIGPLLLDALMIQDMYLAGSILLILSILTLLGTLISDILLALADPRIRQR